MHGEVVPIQREDLGRHVVERVRRRPESASRLARWLDQLLRLALVRSRAAATRACAHHGKARRFAAMRPPVRPQDPAMRRKRSERPPPATMRCWGHEDIIDDALVIGCGIGGPVVAMALQRAGIDADDLRGVRSPRRLRRLVSEPRLQRHRRAARHRRRRAGARRRLPDAAHGDVERHRQAARRGRQRPGPGRRHDQPDDAARAAASRAARRSEPPRHPDRRRASGWSRAERRGRRRAGALRRRVGRGWRRC